MLLIMNILPTLGAVYTASAPLPEFSALVGCPPLFRWETFLHDEILPGTSPFVLSARSGQTLDVDVQLIICWKQKVISKYWKQIFQMLAGTIRAKWLTGTGRKSKLGRQERERERSPLTDHFYFGKINFLILKMPRFYIGNFMIVFTVDGKNQFEN